jgi:hypothetical protein
MARRSGLGTIQDAGAWACQGWESGGVTVRRQGQLVNLKKFFGGHGKRGVGKILVLVHFYSGISFRFAAEGGPPPPPIRRPTVPQYCRGDCQVSLFCIVALSERSERKIFFDFGVIFLSRCNGAPVGRGFEV